MALKYDEPNVMVVHTHSSYNFKEYTHQVPGKPTRGHVDTKKVDRDVMDMFRGRVYVALIGNPPYYSPMSVGNMIVAMASVLGPKFIEEFVMLIHRKFPDYYQFIKYLSSSDFMMQYKFAPYLIHLIKTIQVEFYSILTRGPTFAHAPYDDELFYQMLNTFTKRDPPPNMKIAYDRNETLGLVRDQAEIPSVPYTPFTYNDVQDYETIDIPGTSWDYDSYFRSMTNAFRKNTKLINASPVTERSFEFVNGRLVSNVKTIGEYKHFNPSRPEITSLNQMNIPLGLYVSSIGDVSNVYIRDEYGSMSDILSHMSYSDSINPGAPSFSATLGDVLTVYADLLNANNLNDGRDTYIVISACQSFASQGTFLTPGNTYIGRAEASFFYPTYVARQKPLTYRGVVTGGIPPTVVSKGSGIFEKSTQRPGGRRRVNIKYRTITPRTIRIDPTLDDFLRENLERCFPPTGGNTYIRGEPGSIDPYIGHNIVLFYKRTAPSELPLFFFTYKISTDGRTAYIYNVCSDKITGKRIEGFVRNSLRLWLEKNRRNYNNIVLGVDMQQPADAIIRLVGIYCSVGFTPSNFVSHIEEGSAGDPSTILLSFKIEGFLPLRPVLPKMNYTSIVDNISASMFMTFDNAFRKFNPSDITKYIMAIQVCQYMIKSLVSENKPSQERVRIIQDQLENNRYIKQIIQMNTGFSRNNEINDLTAGISDVNNLMQDPAFVVRNSQILAEMQIEISKSIFSNEDILDMVVRSAPQEAQIIADYLYISQTSQPNDNEIVNCFNALYNIMMNVLLPEYKQSVNILNNNLWGIDLSIEF